MGAAGQYNQVRDRVATTSERTEEKKKNDRMGESDWISGNERRLAALRADRGKERGNETARREEASSVIL